ncbi:hypothetical protein [Leucobacter sp. 1207-22]|uniref:hypothetical protein n=1 Tax=Leucobacter sp. 1207-22 TaxID=2604456 RepID=UPI00406364BA
MSMTRDEWDEQCSRWRWPEGENLVVYPLGEGRVRVLDERTGVTWQVLKEEVDIDSGVPQLFRSAARDYFKAHEPKPWHGAKPGAVWLVKPEGYRDPMALTVIERDEGLFFLDPVDEMYQIVTGAIDSARRIWPEAADA